MMKNEEIGKKINELREKLDNIISLDNLQSDEVMEISKEIDVLIARLDCSR